jgi:RNA polymerase sigma-70 factor (family 1)
VTLPLWFALDADVPDSQTGMLASRVVPVVPAHVSGDPDAGAIGRLRAGDVDTLAELFDAHAPALIKFATALVGASDAARDVVQDVFFDTWNRRETLHVRTTIRAYLFAATRGRALTALRAARIEGRYRDSASALGTWLVPNAPSQPDDLAEHAELSQQVALAMARLTPRVRAVAELRWYGKMSYTEIAGVLGVSERTVNNQLTTAAKTLRVLLAHPGKDTPDR